MPEISVIVPVYNVEKYIHRCIDSILAQTFTDFELILVDDGSPDNCGAICDEYSEQDYRIRVIHQKNGGVSRARNAGLRMARGEYITFCDSDDFLQPDWLEGLFACCRNQACDMVSAGYTVCTETGKEVKFAKHKEEEHIFTKEQEMVDFVIRRVLMGSIGWEVCTKLFKREIITTNNLQFCESCENFAEDMAFVIEYLLYCETLFICDSVGYYYVRRESSMMGTSADKIKLNALNEVSKQFGTRFLSRSNLEDKDCIFAVMHFLIMKNQYDKVLELRRHQQLSEEISKIIDRAWYRKKTWAAIKAYDQFVAYLGKPKAQKAMLITSYCLHKKWNLHKYISAFFYKYIYSGE